MPTNLFEQANETGLATQVKGRKQVDQSIDIAGLGDYCALTVALKALEGEAKVQRGPINDQILEYFVEKGCQIRNRPDNFDGRDGDTMASCQLRKRGANSPLQEAEVNFLNNNEIPFDTITDVHETYIFNPEHADWVAKNSTKMSNALRKMGAPANLILKQVGNTTNVVSDDSINAIFSKPREIVRQLLPIVGVLAIRRSGELPLEVAWESVRKLFVSKPKAKKK